MKPGRDLDALIAEGIFGCKLKESNADYHCLCVGNPHEHYEDGCYWHLKEYSQDIRYAWEVVEEIKNKQPKGLKTDYSLTIMDCGKNGWAIGWCYYDNWEDSVVKKTLPHAISLFALKAVGYTPANGGVSQASDKSGPGSG